jgi:hypothetical protein
MNKFVSLEDIIVFGYVNKRKWITTARPVEKNVVSLIA